MHHKQPKLEIVGVVNPFLSQKEAVVKVAMVQKITNRVLEVTDAELDNVGDCEYRVKLVGHRANLEQGFF